MFFSACPTGTTKNNNYPFSLPAFGTYFIVLALLWCRVPPIWRLLDRWHADGASWKPSIVCPHQNEAASDKTSVPIQGLHPSEDADHAAYESYSRWHWTVYLQSISALLQRLNLWSRWFPSEILHFNPSDHNVRRHRHKLYESGQSCFSSRQVYR